MFDSRTPVQFTELINLGLFINRSIFSWIGSAALSDQAPATYIATLARRGQFCEFWELYTLTELRPKQVTPGATAAGSSEALGEPRDVTEVLLRLFEELEETRIKHL